jgi:hypothetical protein
LVAKRQTSHDCFTLASSILFPRCVEYFQILFIAGVITDKQNWFQGMQSFLIRFWNHYCNKTILSDFQQCVSTKLNMMINEEVFQVYKNFVFAIFAPFSICKRHVEFCTTAKHCFFLNSQNVFKQFLRYAEF